MPAVAEQRKSGIAGPVARVSVELLGERYVIRGDADAGYIAEVARFVDERMRELLDAAPGMQRSKLAVLAAINIADELFQARLTAESGGDLPQAMDEQIAARARQLITLLDEGLIGEVSE